MFGLDLLYKVVGGEPAAIQAGRCLHRYRRSTCKACVEKCPLGCIYLSGDAPRIAGDCRGCGVCVSACPVGVFSVDRALYGLAGATENAGPVDLACALGQATDSSTKVPCLGYLSVGNLLALGAGRRPVRLHVAGCVSCSLGSAREQIRESAARANTLAGVFALPATVQLVADEVDTSLLNKQTGYSRRELFARLGGRGAQAGADAAAALQEQLSSIGVGQVQSRTISDHRASSLLVQLKHLAAKKGVNNRSLLPLWRPLAGDVCDLCGLCAATCPTGAMVKIDDGSTVQLRWNAADCWSCGLCQDVCPSRAIQYREGVPVSAFAGRAIAILASGVSATCDDCHGRFVGRHGESVCARCRDERRLGVSEADPFGLGRPKSGSASGTSLEIIGVNKR